MDSLINPNKISLIVEQRMNSEGNPVKPRNLWPRDPGTGLLPGEEIWVDRNKFSGIERRKLTLDQVKSRAA